MPDEAPVSQLQSTDEGANLVLTLPVVDDNDRLLGVVTADDVLELVIKEK